MKLNKRKSILVFTDAVIFFFASFIPALCYRFTGIISSVSGATRIYLMVVFSFTVFSIGAFYISGEYNRAWKYTSKKSYLKCCILTLITTLLSMLLMYLVAPLVNDKILMNSYIYFLTVYFISTACTNIFRFVAKRYYDTLTGISQINSGKRTLIIGAGNSGQMVAREVKQPTYIQNKKNVKYNVIGFLDDDPNVSNDKICGAPVIGNTKDVQRVCKDLDIEVIFFAIPSCPEKIKSEILRRCVKTDCELKVVPTLSTLFADKPLISQAKKIEIEDLLGREPIKFDLSAIKEDLHGKVCMVTGGGGSIGSELCRQIASFAPKKLVIIDIYENNAYDIQQELIMKYGDSLNLEVLIASVRDRKKMKKILERVKPQIIYHAAAHKHVPLMEVSPEEAIKNNIFGTVNVAQLAAECGVKKFVMISTDKAVNPTNVMGATKRCCEMVVQSLAQKYEGKTEFVAVRFGNVLGSNGSVIPLFKKLIEAGKPLTVTHPKIIRYFMTIPEAVSLVLEAGSMAKGGEIFVLDMGEPVKIVDLAENLIRSYGKEPYVDVDIVFTGLRPGEKLYEEMLMSEEGLKTTANEKIFIGQQIKIDEKDFYKKLEVLYDLANDNKTQDAVAKLADIVPTFKRQN